MCEVLISDRGKKSKLIVDRDPVSNFLIRGVLAPQPHHGLSNDIFELNFASLTFDEALSFAEKTGTRLPNETEWELLNREASCLTQNAIAEWVAATVFLSTTDKTSAMPSRALARGADLKVINGRAQAVTTFSARVALDRHGAYPGVSTRRVRSFTPMLLE
jgi:hypothetical protein